MWKHLRAPGGGIGTRGPGETQLETDRRRVRERIAALQGRARGGRARARDAAHAAAPRRSAPRSSATPTPARSRSSTRSPAPTCSSRTGSSPRSTRPRAGVGLTPPARAGAAHRHRRLHPQAAAPPGGVLPQPRCRRCARPTCCSTWWTPRTRTSARRWRRSRACSRSCSRAPGGPAARVQQGRPARRGAAIALRGEFPQAALLSARDRTQVSRFRAQIASEAPPRRGAPAAPPDRGDGGEAGHGA